MMKRDCPTPEALASFASGSESEAGWRAVVRHLSECDSCRQQVSLLALTAEKDLPMTGPPPAVANPTPPEVPPQPWLPVLRGAAALLVAGAIAWALYAMNRTPAPPKTPRYVDTPQPSPPHPTAPSTSPPRPLPEPAPAPTPRSRPEPTPSPGIRPAPMPEKPASAPSPAPERTIARRITGDIVEAVEVSAGSGRISLIRREGIDSLDDRVYVNPSDRLRAETPASVLLPNGAAVHLAKDTEISVSWSQQQLCYAVNVRRGEALLDLGAEPRGLIIAGGAPGVQLEEAAGQLLLQSVFGALQVTPLDGPAGFHSPSGSDKVLMAHETLVLGHEEDRIVTAASRDPLGPTFPTLAVPAPAPAPRPRPRPAAAKSPGPVLLTESLGASSYRFRVSGRFVRSGVWHPSGIFTSEVDTFAAVSRQDLPESPHLRRGSRPWNDLGRIPIRSRQERVVAALRRARAPHLQVEEAFAARSGEPRVRSRAVLGRTCRVIEHDLDPEAARGEMEALFDVSVSEGRMAKPSEIFWKTFEGTVEAAFAKRNGHLLRAVDRRRVAYSYRTRSGMTRRWYHVETVYEFSDHGEAELRLPESIRRQLDPRRK